MAPLPFDILDACLDLVRMEGCLSVTEFELIEPIFLLNLVLESIGRLVNAVKVEIETIL